MKINIFYYYIMAAQAQAPLEIGRQTAPRRLLSARKTGRTQSKLTPKEQRRHGVRTHGARARAATRATEKLRLEANRIGKRAGESEAAHRKAVSRGNAVLARKHAAAASARRKEHGLLLAAADRMGNAATAAQRDEMAAKKDHQEANRAERSGRALQRTQRRTARVTDKADHTRARNRWLLTRRGKPVTKSGRSPGLFHTLTGLSARRMAPGGGRRTRRRRTRRHKRRRTKRRRARRHRTKHRRRTRHRGSRRRRR